MHAPATPYFSEATLDDLLRCTGEAIQDRGRWIEATSGDCLELTGVLLHLTNPRARLSRSETRGKLFSALGELCWHLTGGRDKEQIAYYIDWYKDKSQREIDSSAYGPRIFDWEGIDQVGNVVHRLKQQHSSRRAIIQIFAAGDLEEAVRGDSGYSPPCTCTLQFLIRGETEERLHLITYMRSNDWNWGLPHDVFFFTMLQEIVARRLGVGLGSYKHMVGSLHIYACHMDKLSSFLGEGWQATDNPMPAMPKGNPDANCELLLKAEQKLRATGQLDDNLVESVDDYWADLIRLLAVYRGYRDRNKEMMERFGDEIGAGVYQVFVAGKLAEVRGE